MIEDLKEVLLMVIQEPLIKLIKYDKIKKMRFKKKMKLI